MRAWLSRTQIRQRPMLAVYAGLLILIAVVIGAAPFGWLTSRSDDRLAVIANLLSLGTLLLALVAGIVALAAYSAATGLPDLKLQFKLPMGLVNRVRFIPGRGGEAHENTTVTLAVRNDSSYAARSPAVVVEFQDGVILPGLRAPASASAGWTRIEDPYAEGPYGKNILAFQWDGGPDYSIHGDSTRYLPGLSLQGLRPIPERPLKIVIRLLADGYSRREIILPVEFTDDPLKPDPVNIPPEWL